MDGKVYTSSDGGNSRKPLSRTPNSPDWPIHVLAVNSAKGTLCAGTQNGSGVFNFQEYKIYRQFLRLMA